MLLSYDSSRKHEEYEEHEALFNKTLSRVLRVSSCLREKTSLVRGGLDDWRRPADHLVEIGAGRDHRVDRVFLFDLEIDQRRPLLAARRFNGGFDVAARGDRRRRDAEGVRQLGEVRPADRGGCVPRVVEELLPLPDHAEEAVVDDGDV